MALLETYGGLAMVTMCMISSYNNTHPHISMYWSYFCLPRPAMAETEFKLEDC
jgi:hypothetical protein